MGKKEDRIFRIRIRIKLVRIRIDPIFKFTHSKEKKLRVRERERESSKFFPNLKFSLRSDSLIALRLLKKKEIILIFDQKKPD